MPDSKKITAHFLAHWGLVSGVRPRQVPGIDPFAILDFGPTPGRPYHLYATNGMSSYAQKGRDPGTTWRTELYGCCLEARTWVDSLLAGLATYPRDYDTCLGEGHTIAVGQPIDQGTSRFTGILLVEPSPPSLGLVGGIEETVLVHQVVGILADELAFAEKHGGLALWEKLKPQGDLYLDEDRASVV